MLPKVMLLPAPLHEDHGPAKIKSILGSFSCLPPYPGHRAGPRPLILAPIGVMLPITQSKPYSKPRVGLLELQAFLCLQKRGCEGFPNGLGGEKKMGIIPI